MFDQSLIFDGTLPSTGVAITVTRVSTNVLDLLVARDLGAGDTLDINVRAMTTFTATTSATLQVQFETCATEGGSYVALAMSPIYPVAQLIAGSNLFAIVLPMNQLLNGTTGVLAVPGRFLRLTYTVATGPMTAGSVMAWLTATKDRNQYTTYPKNYTAAVAAGQI